MKPGIKSYNHLNEIIVELIKESGRELSASQINDMILNRYRVGKIHMSARSISKRLRGVDEIECTVGRPYLYRHTNANL